MHCIRAEVHMYVNFYMGRHRFRYDTCRWLVSNSSYLQMCFLWLSSKNAEWCWSLKSILCGQNGQDICTYQTYRADAVWGWDWMAQQVASCSLLSESHHLQFWHSMITLTSSVNLHQFRLWIGGKFGAEPFISFQQQSHFLKFKI